MDYLWRQEVRQTRKVRWVILLFRVGKFFRFITNWVEPVQMRFIRYEYMCHWDLWEISADRNHWVLLSLSKISLEENDTRSKYHTLHQIIKLVHVLKSNPQNIYSVLAQWGKQDTVFTCPSAIILLARGNEQAPMLSPTPSLYSFCSQGTKLK